MINALLPTYLYADVQFVWREVFLVGWCRIISAGKSPDTTNLRKNDLDDEGRVWGLISRETKQHRKV